MKVLINNNLFTTDSSISEEGQLALMEYHGQMLEDSKARDLLNEEDFSKIYTNEAQTFVEAHINTTNVQEDTMKTATNEIATGYLTLLGYEFLPRTKGDKRFVGKVMLVHEASKALLADLVEAQEVNIVELKSALDHDVARGPELDQHLGRRGQDYIWRFLTKIGYLDNRSEKWLEDLKRVVKHMQLTRKKSNVGSKWLISYQGEFYTKNKDWVKASLKKMETTARAKNLTANRRSNGTEVLFR